MVNEATGSEKAPRLSEVLFERPCRSFASIAAMPSNVEAVEAALLFSAGFASFVTLVGPSGWGKTHLLEAVSFRRSLEDSCPVVATNATEYLSNPSRADAAGMLILDDVQEVLNKPRLRMMFRVALERRVRAGRPTLLAFTLPKVTRQLKSFLPSVHEWKIVCIEEPAPEERTLLINQMSAAEGLTLSPSLVRIIARQMFGNGRTLAGALKRLRLSGPVWLSSMTTLRACGLLDPFFADNGEWDLKMRIVRASEAHRAQFSKVSSLDLAVYTMLRVAGLSEIEVARAVGIEPADAYLRASRFQTECENGPRVETYVRQFVDLVIQALAEE